MVSTIIVTYPRSQVIDFSVQFSEDPIGLLIPYPKMDSTINGIVRPFSSQVRSTILTYFFMQMPRLFNICMIPIKYGFHNTINRLLLLLVFWRGVINHSSLIKNLNISKYEDKLSRNWCKSCRCLSINSETMFWRFIGHKHSCWNTFNKAHGHTLNDLYQHWTFFCWLGRLEFSKYKPTFLCL